MLVPKTLIFLSAILLSQAIKVSVYYEALCPDSVSFIVEQLHPYYADLKDNIQLEFVPFGKATVRLDSNNRWEFQCQHGSEECKGNMYQSCALDQARGQDKKMDFVYCMMKSSRPAYKTTLRECAVKNNLNMTKLMNCISSDEGRALLAANGFKTSNLDYTLSFVPTIILDDDFDSENQRRALTNFKSLICDNIENNKPKAFYNNETGTWNFSCQHGPEECYGNKVQACVINSEVPRIVHQFVYCAMASDNPGNESALQTCANQVSIPWDPINKCANNSLGDQLLANLGNRTTHLNPKLSHVPRLEFNDKYDQELQDEGEFHLYETVCRLLPDCLSRKQ